MPGRFRLDDRNVHAGELKSDCAVSRLDCDKSNATVAQPAPHAIAERVQWISGTGKYGE